MLGLCFIVRVVVLVEVFGRGIGFLLLDMVNLCYKGEKGLFSYMV